MTERRMSEVMGQGDGLRQILIQLQRSSDIAGNCGYLYRVRETSPQVIAGSVEEDLGFVFQPAKGPGMNDPVPVALIMGAPFRRLFRVFSATSLGAKLGVRSQKLLFPLLQFLAGAGHEASFWAGKSGPEVPANAKSRWIVSSMSLFGHDAPAVTPTVICPDGSHSRVSTS